jgi:hypothetical protein
LDQPEPFFSRLCCINRGDEQSQRRALFRPLGSLLILQSPTHFVAFTAVPRVGDIAKGIKAKATVVI